MKNGMMIAAPILFLRHGETGWNRLGRYQGATDIMLNEAGRGRGADHAQCVKALAREGRFDADRATMVTSPLKRALATAQDLRMALDPSLPLTIDPRLRELSFGRWEGLTSMEVKARYYDERKARKQDRYHFAPQGGDSMAKRRDEVAVALGSLPRHAIVVTHSGIIRLIAFILTADAAAMTMAVGHHGGFLWDGQRLHAVVM